MHKPDPPGRGRCAEVALGIDRHEEHDNAAEAIAAGSLSISNVSTLLEAAGSSDGLLWNPTSSLVIHLWRRGIDASTVLLKLIESRDAGAQRVAQMCMAAKGIPHATAERVLAAGRADKSTKVRDEASLAQSWHQDITT